MEWTFIIQAITQTDPWILFLGGQTCIIIVYYIDTSVLLENILLVKLIKLHSGPEWYIFDNITREFIDDVISVISLYYFINVVLSI